MFHRTVTKEFTFEAAHRLVGGYGGKCKWLHGHGFKVQVTLALRDDADLDRYCFVEDFAEFKQIRTWVDTYWDHATLVAADDDTLIAFLESERQKVYQIRGNPTSENIAEALFLMAGTMLETSRVYVEEVVVWETCTSRASIRVTQ